MLWNYVTVIVILVAMEKVHQKGFWLVCLIDISAFLKK